MKQYLSQRPWLSITPVTVLAGLLYTSWPLGYWLNPVANRGLASNLEALHQPYNWVFISLDITSGLLICIASWWLLRVVHSAQSLLLTTAMLGFGLFGLLTAVDALLPLNCVSTIVQQCGSALHNPYFVLHGIASLGSIGGLTLSIVSIWWLAVHDFQAARIRWLLHTTLLVWFGFGLLTLLLLLEARTSTLAQHIFILVCSLWTAGLPYLAWRHMPRHEQATLLKMGHKYLPDLVPYAGVRHVAKQPSSVRRSRNSTK